MNLNNFKQEKINNILSKNYIFDNFDSLSDKYYRRYSNNENISKFKTPCYFIDEGLLEDNIKSIKEDFYSCFNQNQLKIFYPVKINNHEFILKKMIENQIGLEVASIDEYKLALSLKSEKILYYAPGKTIDDLDYFVKNSNENHTIHIDSFSELRKLKEILLKYKKKVNIGVRIFTDDFGEWQKYGINLSKLTDFIDEACENEFINFYGIHFHTSRNVNSKIYVSTLNKIGEYFSSIDSKYILKIKYIDFGGGFEKSNIEGTYFKKTQKFQLANIIGKDLGEEGTDIISIKSYELKEYILDIYEVIEKEIYPIFGNNIKFYTEPGRIFVSDIMHILTKVVDVKDILNNTVIVDSGVNMVGRQRAEFEYFPVINLSSNGPISNKNAMIYGNLCTTWDHWGYYCYTNGYLKENDLILLSNQGTLTYSLAQYFFINKIPEVFIHKKTSE